MSLRVGLSNISFVIKFYVYSLQPFLSVFNTKKCLWGQTIGILINHSRLSMADHI